MYGQSKLRKLASETTTPVISYGLEHEDARYQAKTSDTVSMVPVMIYM